MAPFDPSVVAPWVLGEGRRGALLLHGFAGTPPELRGLGDHLAAHGWRCSGPAMAGHATSPEDLAATDWTDWAASARQALDTLAAECDQVVVVGQSMGGTMALHLAATDLRIRAVATLAAPIWINTPAKPLLPLLKHVYRWHIPKSPPDLYRVEGLEEIHSYGRRPTRAIDQLFRFAHKVGNELVCIRAPVLIMHGARDSVIDPANAFTISRRLTCCKTVERHLYARSGHSLSVDVDRSDINDRVLRWFDRYCPPETSQSVPSEEPNAEGADTLSR